MPTFTPSHGQLKKVMLDARKRTSGTAIALVIILSAVMALACNGITQWEPVRQNIMKNPDAAGARVALFWLANLASLLVVVYGGIYRFGRLSLRHAGWIFQRMPAALLLTAMVWGIIQGVVAIGALAVDGTVELAPGWTTGKAGTIFGLFLGQLMALALYEETVFRGFLFPQLYFLAHDRMPRIVGVLVAAVGSQLVFALYHIPHRLFVQELTLAKLLIDQMMLFLAGLLFLGIYAATGNLGIAVGLHALNNAAPVLFKDPVGAGNKVPMLVGLCIIAWMPLYRRLQRRPPTLHPISRQPDRASGPNTSQPQLGSDTR